MNYEPQTAFEGFVVTKLKEHDVFESNHMAHHQRVYGRLWWTGG